MYTVNSFVLPTTHMVAQYFCSLLFLISQAHHLFLFLWKSFSSSFLKDNYTDYGILSCQSFLSPFIEGVILLSYWFPWLLLKLANCNLPLLFNLASFSFKIVFVFVYSNLIVCLRISFYLSLGLIRILGSSAIISWNVENIVFLILFHLLLKL